MIYYDQLEFFSSFSPLTLLIKPIIAFVISIPKINEIIVMIIRVVILQLLLLPQMHSGYSLLDQQELFY